MDLIITQECVDTIYNEALQAVLDLQNGDNDAELEKDLRKLASDRLKAVAALIKKGHLPTFRVYAER